MPMASVLEKETLYNLKLHFECNLSVFVLCSLGISYYYVDWFVVVNDVVGLVTALAIGYWHSLQIRMCYYCSRF